MNLHHSISMVWGNNAFSSIDSHLILMSRIIPQMWGGEWINFTRKKRNHKVGIFCRSDVMWLLDRINEIANQILQTEFSTKSTIHGNENEMKMKQIICMRACLSARKRVSERPTIEPPARPMHHKHRRARFSLEGAYSGRIIALFSEEKQIDVRY